MLFTRSDGLVEAYFESMVEPDIGDGDVGRTIAHLGGSVSK